ncbi:ImmA/IrrE family metallo-endopeptidase [Sulfoacidibacillus thermotolerans]|nr:ImmA/IrrE family metallo-endopeptidase [Sulfoacidibacillus thermotolerans]
MSEFEKTIWNFYLQKGIKNPAEISLYVFDDQANFEVIKRKGASYAVEIGDVYYIFLDSSIPLPNRREQLAHEIGHVLLHAGNQLWTSPLIKEKQEAQAKKFAHYALIPSWFLIEKLQDAPETIQGKAATLADFFCVSEPFVIERLFLLEKDISGGEIHARTY